MAHGEIEIRAPRALVWKLLVNPELAVRYMPEITKVHYDGGPAAVGARNYTLALGPRMVPCSEFISVCDVHREFCANVHAGTNTVSYRYELEPMEEGSDYRTTPPEHTRLRWTAKVSPRSPLMWLPIVLTLFLPVMIHRFLYRRRLAEIMDQMRVVAEQLTLLERREEL